MNLKKNIFRIVTVIYDIVALFWCYVLASNLIYAFTQIGVNNGSIGIIGGAELPTLMFMLKTRAIFRFILHITFVLLHLITAVLFTITAFKPKTKRSLNICLIVLLGVALTYFMLIPLNSYIVALYAVLKAEYLIPLTRIIYYVVSAVSIFVNVLALVKQKADVK